MSVAGVWRQEGEVSMACRIWLVGSDPVVGGELEGWLTAAGFTTERLSHAEALSRLGATRPRVDRVVVDGGSHSGSLELLPHFRAAGVPVTLLLEAEDLLAVCVQHEMDHLQGKVFVEYLSMLKQNRIKAKLAKKARITA